MLGFISSFLAHKEFRFLLQILPISMHYCGVFFQDLCKKPRLRKKKHKTHKELDVDQKSGNSEKTNNQEDPSSTEQRDSLSEETQHTEDTETRDILGNVESTSKKYKSKTDETDVCPQHVQEMKHKSNLMKAWVLVMVFLLINIPAAVYFGLIHQRGTVVVMKFLYDESFEKNMDVLFLMPCHSTPYYR